MMKIQNFDQMFTPQPVPYFDLKLIIEKYDKTLWIP